MNKNLQLQPPHHPEMSVLHIYGKEMKAHDHKKKPDH